MHTLSVLPTRGGITVTTMAQDYLSEKVSYGGLICTGGQMINHLREVCPNERCVQAYLIGHAQFEQAERVRTRKETAKGD